MFTSSLRSIMYYDILERFVRESRNFELIYTSHSSWPLPKFVNAGNRANISVQPISLSVLDSSFNPPTKAHFALASLPVPSDKQPFAAKLLLYSIKNADKTPKPDDATSSQRLEMMVLLAKELQALGKQDEGSQNIAVAVCQEPTFVGKSTVLGHFLRHRMEELSSGAKVQLTFLLGYDTLERLFAVKYYGSEENMKQSLRKFLSSQCGDGSKILCATRSTGASYSQVNKNILQTAAEYIDTGAVVVTELEEAHQALSSSEVRQDVLAGSVGWEAKVPGTVSNYIRENNLYKTS